MAIGLETLKHLLSGFKPEKKPVVPTLSSCINAIMEGEASYRDIKFEIRNNPNLTPSQKTALIRGLDWHYDPSWDWRVKNGQMILRGQDKTPQT